MVKLGCKEAATRVLIKEFVESGMADAIQKVLDKAPDLVTGKATWEDVWPQVVEAFIVGGIKGRIIGKMGAKEAFGKSKGLGASQITGKEIDEWAAGIDKLHN